MAINVVSNLYLSTIVFRFLHRKYFTNLHSTPTLFQFFQLPLTGNVVEQFFVENEMTVCERSEQNHIVGKHRDSNLGCPYPKLKSGTFLGPVSSSAFSSTHLAAALYLMFTHIILTNCSIKTTTNRN